MQCEAPLESKEVVYPDGHVPHVNWLGPYWVQLVSGSQGLGEHVSITENVQK